MSWIKLEHALDEILELSREEGFSVWLALAVCSPEDVGSIGCNASIEWICWLSSCEWWMLSNRDEEDNCCGKEIHALSGVWLFEMDLRSHVIESSKFGVEHSGTISAFNWSSETKICNFEVIVGIKEKILWFEISVCHTLLMTVV